MHKLSLTVLVAILTLQISTVRVDFSLPAVSFGVFSEKLHNTNPVNPIFRPTRVAEFTATQNSGDSLVFVGDVLLARNVEYLMQTHDDSYPYQGISFNRYSSNPYVVGNFESAIPKKHIQTPAKMIQFSTDVQYLSALRKAGFTHVSLANNHSLDFGQSEFIHTVDSLEKNGLQSFGHQKNLSKESVEFVTIDDQVIALIAAHTLETLPSYSDLRLVMEHANARSDLQIVYVHWGTEYVSKNNRRQREAAERFEAAGADLIVGHHPHVVQNVDMINDTPVFYSLGNYIFDQYDAMDTQTGLLLHLDFDDSVRISLLPVTSVGTLSQPNPMSKKNHAQFLQNLAKSSAPGIQEEVSAGMIELQFEVASSSKVAMMNK